MDALIKNNAPMHQHNLSVGNENVKYFTSFGFVDQDFFNSRDFDYRRYNTRSNIDIKINERINFFVDLSYEQDIREAI